MAQLRTAMDAAFWDLNIASPQTLDGWVNLVPGEPIPLDGARASRALRFQQISLLRNGFPLGIIPSYSPTHHNNNNNNSNNKDLGSFYLQTLLLQPSFSNWWLGLIAQFRPKKLISDIKAEISGVEEWEMSAFKDLAKHFFNKSLYSFGLTSQLFLPPSTSCLISTERHGDKKRRRHKFMLFHKLPNHDITMEAAWPGLFIDHKGKYWDVPESISLDLSSLVSEDGFRYRFGIHKNSGYPQAVNAIDGEAPSALMPGLCAKAAFSYEKSRDIWRQREKEEDIMIKTDKGVFMRPSYDVRLKEPHAAISGIIGGTCAAWFGSGSRESENLPLITKKRSPLSADLFGSVCYTYQHGNFRKLYGDLTRVDARLNLSSATSLCQKVFSALRGFSYDRPSLPTLNLILQQQVAGPIVFRMDTQLSLESSSSKYAPLVEDLIYSVSYSLRLLRSGKVVAWYSPKRKEGMVELRLYEF